MSELVSPDHISTSELLDQRERINLPAYLLGHTTIRELVEIADNVIELPNPYRVDRFPLLLSQNLSNAIESFKAQQEELGNFIEDAVVLRIDKGSRYGDIARFHEARMFKQEWYKDLSPETYADEMHEEYGIYDAASRFLMVMDTRNKKEDGTYHVMGISRMVDGSHAPLKTVVDMDTFWSFPQGEVEANLRLPACDWYEMSAEERIKCGLPEYTWDISSLAVDNDYRDKDFQAKTNIYASLSHEMSVWALEEGVRTWTTVLVTKFFNLYTKFKGIPFRAICDAPEKVHMGALSRPAVLHLYELPAMKSDPNNKRSINGFHELVQGEGLNYTPIKL